MAEGRKEVGSNRKTVLVYTLIIKLTIGNVTAAVPRRTVSRRRKTSKEKNVKAYWEKRTKETTRKKKGEEAVEKIPMWISFRVRSCAVSKPAAPA
jgi:hypothetical protein